MARSAYVSVDFFRYMSIYYKDKIKDYQTVVSNTDLIYLTESKWNIINFERLLLKQGKPAYFPKEFSISDYQTIFCNLVYNYYENRPLFCTLLAKRVSVDDLRVILKRPFGNMEVYDVLRKITNLTLKIGYLSAIEYVMGSVYPSESTLSKYPTKKIFKDCCILEKDNKIVPLNDFDVNYTNLVNLVYDHLPDKFSIGSFNYTKDTSKEEAIERDNRILYRNPFMPVGNGGFIVTPSTLHKYNILDFGDVEPFKEEYLVNTPNYEKIYSHISGRLRTTIGYKPLKDLMKCDSIELLKKETCELYNKLGLNDAPYVQLNFNNDSLDSVKEIIRKHY